MSYQFKDQKELAFAWTHQGLAPNAEKVSVKDAIATPNAGVWMPRVIEYVVKEAIEPLLIGPSLLQRIQFSGEQIVFPSVGALVAADIPEGGSYPERQLQAGTAISTIVVGKSGVAVKITEEMIRRSQFDIINMHIAAAGKALARHKEKKIFNAISNLGNVCFDNLNPTLSTFGVTHGRALNGSANGAAVMDDVFDCFAQVISQGFTPDTVLMHPLTWVCWMKDPILRSFALASGGGSFFASYNGNPAARAPWSNGGQGGMGASGGQDVIPGGNAGSQTATALSGYTNTANGAPKFPSYFPFPFRILVSPFMRFDTASKLTDIIMFDSANLGALVVDEDVTVDEWNDQSCDIRKIKLRERYGIAILEEGLAIGVMKNVKVTANQVVLPAQSTLDVSGTLLGDISATTALSL